MFSSAYLTTWTKFSLLFFEREEILVVCFSIRHVISVVFVWISILFSYVPCSFHGLSSFLFRSFLNLSLFFPHSSLISFSSLSHSYHFPLSPVFLPIHRSIFHHVHCWPNKNTHQNYEIKTVVVFSSVNWMKIFYKRRAKKTGWALQVELNGSWKIAWVKTAVRFMRI